MSEIIRGIVAAILNFMKGIMREDRKASDADNTSDLRDRIRDRVRGNSDDPSTPDGGV